MMNRLGFVTPLRYPGGKRKLYRFFSRLLEVNSLQGGHYIEPYAGGAGLALSLLMSGNVQEITINDLDIALYAFWHAVLHQTEALCERILRTSVDLEEWERQSEIIREPDGYSLLDVGFAAFFLNRTNRSGILRGGVIGGREQRGKWKLDARFNKEELIGRMHCIATYRDRIHLYHLDAVEFLRRILPTIPRNKALVYLDPPYYAKGASLYYNHYTPSDHRRLAQTVRQMEYKWVVSYDNVPEIRKLFWGHRFLTYRLYYTAHERYLGNEVMFFSHALALPDILHEHEGWHPMRVTSWGVSFPPSGREVAE